VQIIQLIVSIRNREALRDTTGDPWNGRTLEWSIPSVPQFYNFAITPVVYDRDAFWEEKEKIASGQTPHERVHEDIHMPKNTGTGFIIAVFSGFFGFGTIWHIYWMIVFGLIGIFATVIARTFNSDTDYYIKAIDVEKMEKERAKKNTVMGAF
jgi:cytochrome o ubiquinol oxidase subunit 1